MSSSLFSSADERPDERHTVQEDIEWCDVWLPHLNEHRLPRVLLIGDSITKGYYSQVEELLEGAAYVGRIATSRSVGDIVLLRELDAVLEHNRFDIIHFNNGLHGWHFSEIEYQRHFPALLATLGKHQPQAKLIWATTTPMRVAGDLPKFDSRTERVQKRNEIALQFAQKAGIFVNDLFQIAHAHTDYFSDDGVHFNAAGTSALAAPVAAAIRAML